MKHVRTDGDPVKRQIVSDQFWRDGSVRGLLVDSLGYINALHRRGIILN